MQVNINYVRGADDPKSGTVLGGRFADQYMAAPDHLGIRMA
ncbi:MAG: hypothetical protein WBC90_03680 [Albidovulum sp.]